MNANELFSAKVSTVKGNICVALFNEFIKHYNLTKEQIEKAWTNFDKLSTMDITLGLALTTSVATAKF